MFHHRSCGTTDLVALMAAHRSALRDLTALRQQDIVQVRHRLEQPAASHEGARAAPRQWPRRASAEKHAALAGSTCGGQGG